jgi:hypothetical protein
MRKVQTAKELVSKAWELRGSRASFLRGVAEPIRAEIRKITFDSSLSGTGKSDKIKALKEAETKKFMRQIALRKQEYQHHLNKAMKLAKETIEERFVTADDITRGKFQRDFSELKFKIALKGEKEALIELKTFVDKAQDSAYASLIMENFHELAGRFNSSESKLGLSRTYEKLKADFTPVEVSDAFEIIEQVDGSINNKMFMLMMPGDNPDLNPDYSVISELFTQDAVDYYQEPEAYFAKLEDVQLPVYVDPDEVVEQEAQEKLVQKSRVDQAYDNLSAILQQKVESGELKLGGIK